MVSTSIFLIVCMELRDTEGTSLRREIMRDGVLSCYEQTKILGSKIAADAS